MKTREQKADFHMRVSEEFLAELDDIRAEERPMPTRAEILRRLVKRESEKRARRTST